MHPNFLGFLLLLSPNLSVLKFPLETASSVGTLFSLVEPYVVLSSGSTSFFGVSGFGGHSDVGLIFLVDLHSGMLGGGFVVKVSALMRAELGSCLGWMFFRFLAAGLLSSSLLTLSPNSYETFKLTLCGSQF